MALAALTAGGRPAFDEAALRALRQRDWPGSLAGPEWLATAVDAVSLAGGLLPLAILTVSALGLLRLAGHRLAGWWVLLSGAGGFVLEESFKRALNRPRPAVVPHLAMVASASFPSGHAMMSAIVFLTLALALARLASTRAKRAAIIAAAAVASIAVGSARLFQGVHTPTDVLAGWSLGAGWAMAAWLAARWFAKRQVAKGQGD
ncbi:MAG: phosphatase PAP2 family protein [Phycisphaerae bacterium]|nr:phosphatase PAP2 family protein [Phycisphaerae bacterium]